MSKKVPQSPAAPLDLLLVHIREIGKFAAFLAVSVAILLVAVATMGVATVRTVAVAARTRSAVTAIVTATVTVAAAVTTTVATRLLFFVTLGFREQSSV